MLLEDVERSSRRIYCFYCFWDDPIRAKCNDEERDEVKDIMSCEVNDGGACTVIWTNASEFSKFLVQK